MKCHSCMHAVRFWEALGCLDRSEDSPCFCQAMNLRVPEKQVPFASPLDGVMVSRNTKAVHAFLKGMFCGSVNFCHR